MTPALVGASAGAFGNPSAVLVILVAVLVLLGLRAWCLTVGILLTRAALRFLDGAIGALSTVFVLLVAIRFATIG